MSHSHTNLLYHMVFGTKYRTAWLEEAIRPALFTQIGHIIKTEGGIALEINGMVEHVHILCKLKPTHKVSEILSDIKSRSSGWIHRTYPDLAEFAWQTGYGAFTVSQSQSPTIRAYIKNQEEHHRTKPFEQEFRALLKKHGVEIENEETFWG